MSLVRIQLVNLPESNSLSVFQQPGWYDSSASKTMHIFPSTIYMLICQWVQPYWESRTCRRVYDSRECDIMWQAHLENLAAAPVQHGYITAQIVDTMIINLFYARANCVDPYMSEPTHVWDQMSPTDSKLAATLEYHGTSEYHVSPDSWRLLDHSRSGKVQPPPLPSEPFGVSTRGLSQPKFGQQNEDGASMPSHMPDVIMTLVSYFCGLPGLARKACKHYKDMASVPYQSHNLPKQCDTTLCWCRQVRRQRTLWHVYLQLQMCWERAKGTTARC